MLVLVRFLLVVDDEDLGPAPRLVNGDSARMPWKRIALLVSIRGRPLDAVDNEKIDGPLRGLKFQS